MVSDGSGPRVSVADAGDEAYWLAARLSVPVFVGADRVRSVQSVSALGCDAAVLDDGFSHRRLHRDLDILSVRPTDLCPSAAMFPAGSLREPPTAAARAHLVTGFDTDFRQNTAGVRRPDFTFAHEPLGLVDAGGRRSSLPPGPTDVYLVSGIADPVRFAHTARASGFRVVGEARFRDHHVFNVLEITKVFSEAAAKGAEMLLTTEKDLVRFPVHNGPLPLRALRIETRIVAGEARLLGRLLELFS